MDKVGLSEAQVGIWLGQQLDLQSPLYNAAEAIEIFGDLDEALFRLALEKTLAEATAVNVRFINEDSGTRQYLALAKFTLSYQDHTADADPFAKAMLYLKENVAEVVDLEKGPLFHQELIKIGEQRFLWYQRIHHIACDGYAFALISQRVADVYKCLMDASDSSGNFSEDGLNFGKPFGDYLKVLIADEQYQSSNACKKDKAFWLEELDQMLNPVTLGQSQAPICKPSIGQTVILSNADFLDLKNICEDVGCNWVEGLLSAVAYLIFRHTAAPEVTLGLPVAGRMGTPALRVPAMVMNIIPLRVRFNECSSLQDILLFVANKMRQIRRHQRYRYEHLRRDLKLVGGDSRLFGPFVNIMAFDRTLDFHGQSAQVHGISAGPVEDLSFSFSLSSTGAIAFSLEANPDRYSKENIAAYQVEFMTLLRGLVSNPLQKMSVHHEKLSWLDGGVNSSPTVPVVRQIKQQMIDSPDSLAVVFGDKSLTYTQLWLLGLKLAKSLTDAKVKSEDVVALAFHRGEQAIISCLACLMLEATYAFIDPDGPEARNALILGDANPSVVLKQYKEIALSHSGAPQFVYCDLMTDVSTPVDSAINKNSFQESFQEDSDSLAYIIYTSGSTGTPKGVMVGQKALSSFVVSANSSYSIDKTDVVLQFAPLHFDASVEEIFLTLCHGATLHIRNQEMLNSIPDFLTTCEQWELTVLDLPTAFWHELVYYCSSSNNPLPPKLHTIIIGGEAVLPERVQQWHALFGASKIRLLNTYGPSEATVVATCACLKNNADLVTIGKPLLGRKIAVVDNSGNLIPKGQEGELLLLGESLGRGYLNLPEVTRQQFIPTSFSGISAPLRAYRTGDLVRVNAQNNIEFLGRLDDEVKISGHRINPLEVESALLLCNGIGAAAVTVQVNSYGEKYLAAFVVMAGDLDLVELRIQLAQVIPAAMLPSSIQQIPELPKNAAGKIDKNKLKGLLSEECEKVILVNEDQQHIIDIWHQVLGIPNISLDDDFFLIGGQSLQTIQVANRLSAQFEQVVPVTVLFQHPTVRALAAFIADSIDLTPQLTHKQRMDKDSQLPTDIYPRGVNVLSSKVKTILLTGATGFVGSQLLHQLLQQTQATIICLIRSKSETLAWDRLQEALLKQGLRCDLSRIKVVLSDLEKPNLGLTETQFNGLSSDVDIIFHNAANTSVMRDYQSLRAANVLSVQELLRCACSRSIPIHFISTIAISPSSKDIDQLAENFVPWHSGLQDGYQQTKWVAETLLKSAIDRGFDVTVYRLARVIGDVHSGYVNSKDLMWNILSTSIRNGCYPDMAIREPWTPVDIIANAIVYTATQTQNRGVFNLVPDTTVSLTQLFDWLPSNIFNIVPVSLLEWLDCLQGSECEDDKTILGFFQQRQAFNQPLSMPAIQNTRIKNILIKNNVHLPKIDELLFSVYLRYAIKSGLINTLTQPVNDPKGALCEPA